MSWIAVAIGGSAVIGALGSNAAANTQSNAANQASANQMQMYNQNAANVYPWVSAGQGALSEIMAGLGMPMNQSGGTSGAPTSGGVPTTSGVPTTGGMQTTGAAPMGQTGINAWGIMNGQSPTQAPNTGATPATGTPATSYPTTTTSPAGYPSLQPTPYTQFGATQFAQSPEMQLLNMQNANAINSAENASSLTGGMNSNNMKGLMQWTQGNDLNAYNTALNNYMSQYQQGNQATQQTLNNLMNVSGQGLNAGLQQGVTGANTANAVSNNIVGAGNANAAGTVGVTNALTGGIGSAYNNYLQQAYTNPANSSNYSNYFTQSGGITNPANANL